MPSPDSDFFVFGATSELVQRLFVAERAWFEQNVRRLILVQRGTKISDAYAGFDRVVVEADVADSAAFRRALDELVAAHVTPGRSTHVLPTYGRFSWNYAERSPRFAFTDDGLQINLNCRLQIIEAFRPFAAHTRFHLLGSLFSCFPYTGDYALGMWFINQLPAQPAYRDLDLRVYNLGGMKTRFWRHDGPGGDNPMVHREIPTAALIRAMASDRRGVTTFYPTAASRIACWLGRRGVRVL